MKIDPSSSRPSSPSALDAPPPFARRRRLGFEVRALAARGLVAAGFVAAGLACALGVGCKPKAETTEVPAGSASAAEAAGSATAAATAQGSANGAEGAAPAADAKGGMGIEVKVVDFQLFHPLSPTQSLTSMEQDDQVETIDPWVWRSMGWKRYGVGFVLEATNRTGMLLNAADFEGEVTFTSDTGIVRCPVLADDVRTGSAFAPRVTGQPKSLGFFGGTPPSTGYGYGGNSKPQRWFDESASSNEYPWRVDEPIRLRGRTTCGYAVLADLAPGRIHATVKVTARPVFTKLERGVYTDADFEISLAGDKVRFVNRRTKRLTSIEAATVVELEPGQGGAVKRVRTAEPVEALRIDGIESAPIEFDVHPDTLTLQLVNLGADQRVYASANRVITLEGEQVTFRDAAKVDLGMHEWKREDLPATSPDVALQVAELSAQVAKLELVHYLDEPTIAKGRRMLHVTWKLTLPQALLEARFRKAVDDAKAALTRAEEAATAAASGDATAKAKASSEVSSAKSALSSAESAFKSGVASERSRLARALPCGDVRVVTTGETLERAVNASEASQKCAELATVDEVEVTANYVLGRYDIPVALFFRADGKTTFSPIASKPLARLDSR